MSESIEDILAVANDPAYHRVVTARIPFIPQALRDEHAELDTLLPTLTSDTIDAHPRRQATAERLAEIEAEIEESARTFRFRSIGHRAWADLLRRHQPREQDRKAGLDHNPDTFPYEAIAASCTEPVMTADQVRQLERTEVFDVAAWTEMWSACLRANVAEQSPKSLTASLLLKSAESAKRPTTTASPEASSSGE